MTPAELRDIIARLGYSQALFAFRLGVSTRTVEYWLAGKVKINKFVAAEIRGME